MFKTLDPLVQGTRIRLKLIWNLQLLSLVHPLSLGVFYSPTAHSLVTFVHSHFLFTRRWEFFFFLYYYIVNRVSLACTNAFSDQRYILFSYLCYCVYLILSNHGWVLGARDFSLQTRLCAILMWLLWSNSRGVCELVVLRPLFLWSRLAFYVFLYKLFYHFNVFLHLKTLSFNFLEIGMGFFPCHRPMLWLY